jgi:lipoprotein-anchoring transpeptidase ErfK/SrfK
MRKKLYLAVAVFAACLILGQAKNYFYGSNPPNLVVTKNINPLNSASSTNRKNETLDNKTEVQDINKIINWTEPHKPVRAIKKAGINHKIVVNTSEQKVYIYINYKLEKKMVCSTGLSSHDTPLGTYYINNFYGESFYGSEFKMGAKYWVGFINSTYLFHSVPTDKNGNYIIDEAKKLGSAASHGCVRLSPCDAFWIYENIAADTQVDIN